MAVHRKLTHNDLRKFVIDYIRSQKGWAWPNSTMGVYDSAKKVYRRNTTYRGPADVIGVLPGGRHIEVECKVGRDTLRPDQFRHGQCVKACGGLYLEARDPDQFIAAYLMAIMGEGRKQAKSEEVHYLREFRESERIKP